MERKLKYTHKEKINIHWSITFLMRSIWRAIIIWRVERQITNENLNSFVNDVDEWIRKVAMEG